jgi:hypothetical protein
MTTSPPIKQYGPMVTPFPIIAPRSIWAVAWIVAGADAKLTAGIAISWLKVQRCDRPTTAGDSNRLGLRPRGASPPRDTPILVMSREENASARQRQPPKRGTCRIRERFAGVVRVARRTNRR